MEKSWPGKKRDPPIRVSFSERLYEEQVDPFARAKRWEPCRLDRVDPAGRSKLFVWRKVAPARKVTLPSKKGVPLLGLICYTVKFRK